MLNVILLSEYRRRYALEKHEVYMKPVIMFKSQRVNASNEAHEQFNDLVDTLTIESLQDFLERQALITSEDDSETLSLAHDYYRKDRKSTRLNSSHVAISYAVFCLKKKKQ